MNGIVYYNRGDGYLVRLLVSVYSLRKYTKTPITIISEGESEICRNIAKTFNIQLLEINSDIRMSKPHYQIKTRLNQYSPYMNTLHIDSDTLILQDISPIFEDISSGDFVATQFVNWSTKSGLIRKRLKKWNNICPDYVQLSLDNIYPAINCGMFGWSKISNIFSEWEKLAEIGHKNEIPDEISLQLLLPYYPHIIVSTDYNTSCKYGTITESTKIIHYHGRKHCRGPAIFNSQYWLKAYDEVFNANLASIKDWYDTDIHLMRYIGQTLK